MRAMIRPSSCPTLTIDVTNSLVAALARELARVGEGTPEEFWHEAEGLLEQMCMKSVAGPVSIERSWGHDSGEHAALKSEPGYWGRGHVPGPAI